MRALLNTPSPRLGDCALSFIERKPIDLELAGAQHRAYANALIACGVEVEVLAVNAECPDGVFVEDCAIVLDELAVVARPGHPARRAETAAMAAQLSRYRELERVEAPATIDGGDVLRVGKRIFVGRTARTNDDGIAALRRICAPLGYEVAPLEVRGCLHLKSAVTGLDDGTVLLDPSSIDRELFAGLRVIEVDGDEPMAANALSAPGALIMNAAFPRTMDKVSALGLGYEIVGVNISEFMKAEAALTCMSLLIG